MSADLARTAAIVAAAGLLVVVLAARVAFNAYRDTQRTVRRLRRRSALISAGVWAWRKVKAGGSGGRQRRRPPTQPPGIPPGAARPTVLYRHYDTAGRLLYVGITDAARQGKRWCEHEADKPWFHEVTSSRVSPPYPTRGAALYAEAVAIRDEDPVYNIDRPDPARVGKRAS